MLKKLQWIRILIFWGVLCGFAIGAMRNFQEFSELENRYLATRPIFHWNNFIDGSFQRDLEAYLEDQIPGRTIMVSGKNQIEHALGKSLIGDVYVGTEGRLYEQIMPQMIEDETIQENLSDLKRFFLKLEEQIDTDCISFMGVPDAGNIYGEDLPTGAPYYDYEATYEQFLTGLERYNVIDIYHTLKSKQQENLYYGTDHHWTSQGAYYAYTRWCQKTNHVRVSLEDFYRVRVTDSFYGSLYNRTILRNQAADRIISYEMKIQEPYLVTCDGQMKNSLYDLDEMDSYDYFMGGNYAQVHIENPNFNHKRQRNLLLIKDSFANCFVPYIASEYHNIYMVDLRYFVGDLTEFVAENEITDVLVLYQLSKLGRDEVFHKLRYENLNQSQEEVLEESTEELFEEESIQEESTQEEATQEENSQEFVYDTIETTEKPVSYGSTYVIGTSAFETYSYQKLQAQKYAAGINQLAEDLKGISQVTTILVPLSSGITLPDQYWEQFQIQQQYETIESISGMLSSDVNFVDIYHNLMLHRKEYLYFRTDHHWTALGAYYAYEEFCRSKGMTAALLEQYEIRRYEGFVGSLYTETKLEQLKQNPDTIIAYEPLSDCEMTYSTIYDKVLKGDVLADGDTIPMESKYCVFIHGDSPYADIHNKEKQDGSTCIVVKESFGNAFIPFLTEQYEHVIVIDYRHWSGNLVKLAEEQQAEDVIFINNLFATQNQYLLGKILQVVK